AGPGSGGGLPAGHTVAGSSRVAPAERGTVTGLRCAEQTIPRKSFGAAAGVPRSSGERALESAAGIGARSGQLGEGWEARPSAGQWPARARIGVSIALRARVLTMWGGGRIGGGRAERPKCKELEYANL